MSQAFFNGWKAIKEGVSLAGILNFDGMLPEKSFYLKLCKWTKWNNSSVLYKVRVKIRKFVHILLRCCCVAVYTHIMIFFT